MPEFDWGVANVDDDVAVVGVFGAVEDDDDDADDGGGRGSAGCRSPLSSPDDDDDDASVAPVRRSFSVIQRQQSL